MGVPKVAALHDISGLGRCSLTAAIPILSAMGVQACPMPTAVLSNQTGYKSFAVADLTEHLPHFANEWKRREIRFDGIFTGFLCGPEQAQFAQRFLADFGGKGVLTVVDPVLGDDGERYRVFDEPMCCAVGELVRHADVITPNLTEACMLAGMNYAEVAGAQGLDLVWQTAKRLAELGPRIVVITGIHAGKAIRNVCWLAGEKRGFCVDTKRVGKSYSGTGDVLASILSGGLVRGNTPEQALTLAARLIERAVAQAAADQSDPNDGIVFEPYLSMLTPRAEKTEEDTTE